jgi:hypothetical protein
VQLAQDFANRRARLIYFGCDTLNAVFVVSETFPVGLPDPVQFLGAPRRSIWQQLR